ncbi:hypothetical protein L873DRAFT_1786597 [Choiromyces venosus 120613-1]|uniref:Uncharacterized protein n=1 Tax=Choiromyces venosus 120613-1 TaxID=1336337 RepID=A0A3N4K0C7_9PEZI|nr:hypothetical protein L873DRAFT_1786597 [Choiromyces venosus 120613-1]
MSVFTTTRFVCGHHNFTTNHTGRPPCHDLCRWMEVTFACTRCADDYEEARHRRVMKEWRKRARRLRETVMDWMESVDIVDERANGFGGDGTSQMQRPVMSPVLTTTTTAAAAAVMGVGVLAGGG